MAPPRTRYGLTPGAQLNMPELAQGYWDEDRELAQMLWFMGIGGHIDTGVEAGLLPTRALRLALNRGYVEAL